MDEQRVPPFFARLAAFLIDVALAFAACIVFIVVWVVHALGGVPLTEADFERAFAEFDHLVFWQYAPIVAYVAWSWSGLSGRRSIGKRALRLRVIRE
jgi:uncharacterized RDD family membrane protein YckC